MTTPNVIQPPVGVVDIDYGFVIIILEICALYFLVDAHNTCLNFCKCKDDELFFNLFGFFGLAIIPGAMQAFVLTAISAFQMIFFGKDEKAVFVDIIIDPFYQH